MTRETYVNTGCVVNFGNIVGFLMQLAQLVIAVLCMLEVTGNYIFTLEQIKFFQGAIFVACILWFVAIALSSKYTGLDERTSFYCEWSIFTMYTGIASWLWWNMDARYDGIGFEHRHSDTFGNMNMYWQSHFYNILIGSIFFWPWLPVLHYLSHSADIKNRQRASQVYNKSS